MGLGELRIETQRRRVGGKRFLQIAVRFEQASELVLQAGILALDRDVG